MTEKRIKNLVKDIVRGFVKREIKRAIKENTLEGFTPDEEFLTKTTSSSIRWEMITKVRDAEYRGWAGHKLAKEVADCVINLTRNWDSAIEEENKRILNILNTTI
jgi:hypothetical protein